MSIFLRQARTNRAPCPAPMASGNAACTSRCDYLPEGLVVPVRADKGWIDQGDMVLPTGSSLVGDYPYIFTRVFLGALASDAPSTGVELLLQFTGEFVQFGTEDVFSEAEGLTIALVTPNTINISGVFTPGPLLNYYIDVQFDTEGQTSNYRIQNLTVVTASGLSVQGVAQYLTVPVAPEPRVCMLRTALGTSCRAMARAPRRRVRSLCCTAPCPRPDPCAEAPACFSEEILGGEEYQMLGMLGGASCTMRSGIVPPPEDIVSSPQPVLFQSWGLTQSPVTFTSATPVLNDFQAVTIFSQGYYWQWSVEPFTELPYIVWHNDFDILDPMRLQFYMSSPARGVSLEQPPRLGCFDVRLLPADLLGAPLFDVQMAFLATEDIYASVLEVPVLVFKAGTIIFSDAQVLLAIADSNAPYFLRSSFQPITFSIQTEWN